MFVTFGRSGGKGKRKEGKKGAPVRLGSSFPLACVCVSHATWDSFAD